MLLAVRMMMIVFDGDLGSIRKEVRVRKVRLMLLLGLLFSAGEGNTGNAPSCPLEGDRGFQQEEGDQFLSFLDALANIYELSQGCVLYPEEPAYALLANTCHLFWNGTSEGDRASFLTSAVRLNCALEQGAEFSGSDFRKINPIIMKIRSSIDTLDLL